VGRLKKVGASVKLTEVRIMRVTLKAINEAVNGLAPDVRLAKGDGYFYFTSAETANWLDTTVRVPTLSSLTLEQWIEEFKRLKKVNKTILYGKADDKTSIEPKSRAAARRRQK
jgi:hypothetical protein